MNSSKSMIVTHENILTCDMMGHLLKPICPSLDTLELVLSDLLTGTVHRVSPLLSMSWGFSLDVAIELVNQIFSTINSKDHKRSYFIRMIMISCWQGSLADLHKFLSYFEEKHGPLNSGDANLQVWSYSDRVGE